MKVSNSDMQGATGLSFTDDLFTKDLGWIFRRQTERDYGIDAIVEVVENGETRGQLLALQIKSGPSFFNESNDSSVIFRFDNDHHEYWVDYSLPVMVILHDPDKDVAYWQIVNKNTTVCTGKGWKLEIPFQQVICKEQINDIKSFCEIPVSSSSYEITEQKDVSFGLAKRYSARVQLSNSMSKGEIVQIVHKITEEMRHSKYYRDNLVKEHWWVEKAHVVWLFIYPSRADESHNNFICRSQWVDPELDPKWGPGTWPGTCYGQSLIIDWNSSYNTSSEFNRDHSLTKESYMDKVLPVLDLIKQKVREITDITDKYFGNSISETAYIKTMKNYQSIISDLYDQSWDIGLAPTECNEFHKNFRCLVCTADNIVLFFTDDSLKQRTKQNRDSCVKMYLNDYHKELPELEYELKKLR